jgi:hypothetical protein
MSDKTIPPIPNGVLTDEQIVKISGGDCSVQDYIVMLDELKDAYDKVVDFTSYVIERVSGP